MQLVCVCVVLKSPRSTFCLWNWRLRARLPQADALLSEETAAGGYCIGLDSVQQTYYSVILTLFQDSKVTIKE